MDALFKQLGSMLGAVFAALCCLGVPLLVALLGGSASAAVSGGDSDLLTLLIIGFALGGVLAVAISHWRGSKRCCHESPEMHESAHDKRECWILRPTPVDRAQAVLNGF